MRYNLSFFFLTMYFASCEPNTTQQTVSSSDYVTKIHSLYSKEKDIENEEKDLLAKIKSSTDSALFYDFSEFKRTFIDYVFQNIEDRRTDLLLCNNEGPRRFVVDTLQDTNIKSIGDVIVTNNFISNGYGKIIEADFDYYEHQIKFSDLYYKYGKGLNVELKKLWKSKYNNKMTLGEIFILLREIRIVIEENNIQLEKNSIEQS